MKPAIIAAALALLALPAMAETVLDEDIAMEALGIDGGGRFLISSVDNACPYIAKVMSKAAPEDRILFMTDAEVTFVRHASCDGDCDLLTINNMMAPCQAETGAICAPFAGLTGGVLYDMSFDETGGDLRNCGL